MKKYLFTQLLAMLLVGGIGGVLMDRVVLPYLASIPALKKIPFLGSQSTIVINRREEVRIDEGINNLAVANSVKNALAAVYVHEGEFGGPKFRIIGSTSGVVVTSDGFVITPFLNPRPGSSLTVVLADQDSYPARLAASDPLTGVSFLKIAGKDLPVLKQGFSANLQIGERILAVWGNESPLEVSLTPVTVSRKSVAPASLSRVYDLTRLNGFLSTNLNPAAAELGAVLVNKDGAWVGFLTQFGKDFAVVRSEDLKFLIENFLGDRKITRPSVKLGYQILSEEQAQFLRLPKRPGVLIKSGPDPLRENDFVYAVDGQELAAEDDFQLILLSKKSGTTVKFTLLRDGAEKEVGLSL